MFSIKIPLTMSISILSSLNFVYNLITKAIQPNKTEKKATQGLSKTNSEHRNAAVDVKITRAKIAVKEPFL